MDIGGRTIATIPGKQDIDDIFTLVADLIVDHGIKENIIGGEYPQINKIQGEINHEQTNPRDLGANQRRMV